MLDLYETVLQTYLSIAGPSILTSSATQRIRRTPWPFFGAPPGRKISLCAQRTSDDYPHYYPWIGRGHLDHPRFFPGFARSWESGKQTTSKNKEKTIHQKKGYITKTPQPDLEDFFSDKCLIVQLFSDVFLVSFIPWLFSVIFTWRRNSYSDMSFPGYRINSSLHHPYFHMDFIGKKSQKCFGETRPSSMPKLAPHLQHASCIQQRQMAFKGGLHSAWGSGIDGFVRFSQLKKDYPLVN